MAAMNSYGSADYPQIFFANNQKNNQRSDNGNLIRISQTNRTASALTRARLFVIM